HKRAGHPWKGAPQLGSHRLGTSPPVPRVLDQSDPVRPVSESPARSTALLAPGATGGVPRSHVPRPDPVEPVAGVCPVPADCWLVADRAAETVALWMAANDPWAETLVPLVAVCDELRTGAADLVEEGAGAATVPDGAAAEGAALARHEPETAGAAEPLR